MAFCRIFAVAKASEPSKALSVSLSALSAPLARHFLSVSSAFSGPIVMAVIVPPCFSFIKTASSRA